jgi:hypothetical protein
LLTIIIFVKIDFTFGEDRLKDIKHLVLEFGS